MTNYFLDMGALKEAIARRGYPSVSKFLADAGLHRNTLRSYQSKQKTIFSSAVERIAHFLETDPLKLSYREPPLNIQLDSRSEILSVLTPLSIQYPSIAFMLIGSRAKGKFRRYSDWDVAISGGVEPVSSDSYLALKDKFETASDDLPVNTDLINLDAAPDWFIDELGVEPEFLCGNKEAYYFFLGTLRGFKKANENLDRAG